MSSTKWRPLYLGLNVKWTTWNWHSGGRHRESPILFGVYTWSYCLRPRPWLASRVWRRLSAMAFHISGTSTVCSTAHSSQQLRKHQSSDYWPFCEGEPKTGGSHTQRVSNAESVSNPAVTSLLTLTSWLTENEIKPIQIFRQCLSIFYSLRLGYYVLNLKTR